MPLESFYTSQNLWVSRVFQRVSDIPGGTERDQWYEMVNSSSRHFSRHRENPIVFNVPLLSTLKFHILFWCLRIWSHLLKKSLIENFIFCAVLYLFLLNFSQMNTQKHCIFTLVVIFLSKTQVKLAKMGIKLKPFSEKPFL